MKHQIIVPVSDDIGKTVDRLNEHGAKWVTVKKLDSTRYRVTWETKEDKADDEKARHPFNEIGGC